MHPSRLLLVLLISAPAALGASGREPGARQGAAAALPRLEVGWDPATGRGEVRHLFVNGDEARTCFQCRYAGYTGGLVIGNLNASGLAFIPKAPIRGYRSINVFCATDESIWDRDEGAEYTYGWSENYGSGDDGLRLAYVQGRIIESGPERVVLQSRNAGGCYRVDKVATSRAGAAWWIIATAVTNTCARPVRFDFFTGDDPWLGLYRSSDGDVGWTPLGLLEREAEIAPFTEGGIYDLGNRAMGQGPEPFSNQANFFLIDPGAPLPDRAFLANRFAHEAEEIDPRHVLTHEKMIALNLGWARRTLPPGATFTAALAMGLARTGAPGEVPRASEISDEDWSVWRRWLPGQRAGPAVEFAAEEVDLTIEEGRLTVDGVYHFANPGAASVGLGVRYPVFADARQRGPGVIAIDGRALAAGVEEGLPSVSFPLSMQPHSLARFAAHYEQKLAARRAVYLVTTARRWPTPITRAIFRVRRPARLGPVKISLPVVSSRRVGDQIEDTLVETRFAPEKELVVEW
jgi:hypothetical protein